MLIERQQRAARVRFRHPIRVVTLDGQPRVIRTLTANVSTEGVFVRMPEPLPRGTRVALSLEAGGRALALAQGEVAWGRSTLQLPHPAALPGCGVRFTEFLHPRAGELLSYLVETLDRGKPLSLAPAPRPFRRRALQVAGSVALAAALGVAVWWTVERDAPTADDADAAPAAVGRPARPAAARDDSPAASQADPGEARAPALEVGPTAPAAAAAAPGVAAEAPAPPSPGEASDPGARVELSQAVPEPEATTPGVAPERAAAPLLAGAGPAAPVAGGGAAAPEGRATPEAPATAHGDGEAGPERPQAVAPPEGPSSVTAPSASPRATQPAMATSHDGAEAKASSPRGAVVRAAGGVAPPADGSPASPTSAAKRAPERPAAGAREGRVTLSSGAAAAFSWSTRGERLTLAVELRAGARVERAFVLAGPPRAVFDLVGAGPAKSLTLALEASFGTGVRVGRTERGTRVVVDLSKAPRDVEPQGSSLVLSW